MLQRLFGKQVKPGVEVAAGVTTFLTRAYIIFVNPDILAAAGMDKGALIAVTCLVSGVATLATGLLANAPIAMAPGMGLNAFFAFVICGSMEVPWQTALGIVFLSGLLFLILSLLGLRRRMVEGVPGELVHAIAVGIGVFIAFIGLQNMGLIVKDPNTMVTHGPMTSTLLIGLAGLTVMVILEIFSVKGSLLIGIALATILALLIDDKVALPEQAVQAKVSLAPVFLKMDIMGALKASFLTPIFTLMFMDMFDSVGSLMACTREAEMVDDSGNVPMLDRLLAIDAGATMFGAVAGTSTTTTYIESAAGIEDGGRTGLTSVVTGVCFLLAIFFVPLVGIVPAYATAPALVMVGFFMMRNVGKIDFRRVEVGVPAFLIIIMIAFSFSISYGLAFGFISHTIIRVFQGKGRYIKPVMWLIFALSILFLVLD